MDLKIRPVSCRGLTTVSSFFIFMDSMVKPQHDTTGFFNNNPLKTYL
ncbi:palindromic element RPE4 domain-containing protein [Rickettsia asembonensis]|nr:palindromic element RPE4 domain-containing protein [Rickettsia asembonensis]